VLLYVFYRRKWIPSDCEYRKHQRKQGICIINSFYAYDGIEVKGNKATLTFKNLPPGTYAIAALHDANSNGKMDTNMLGIPKEDYGASNDAKSTFGPPKYKDAKFDVMKDQTITIKMRSVF